MVELKIDGVTTNFKQWNFPADILCGIKVHNVDEAYDLEYAKELAKEFLVDAESADTPHGEMGADEVSGYFRYNNAVFLATVQIEWNRYDKQYYFIDGSTLTSFEPVELTP